MSLVAALLTTAVLVPAAGAAAACPPRTLSSLGPVPNARAVTTQPAPSVTSTTAPETTETTVGSTETTAGEPTPKPTTPAPTRPRCNFVKQIEFPVVTNGEFLSSFGVPRDGGDRWHAGVDISAPTLTPVVAVADGTIKEVRDQPGDCCWVVIEHRDRWTSWYIHLTNDTPGTDDGDWVGIVPGLQIGDEVVAGQAIGWVGDSGNAEPGEPHLHFELRNPGGEPIDPYPSLRAAFDDTPAAFAAPSGSAEADGVLASGRPVFVGAYIDDDELPGAELAMTALLALGVDPTCDVWALRVCPEDPLTTLEAKTWIASLMDSPPPSIAYGAELLELDGRDPNAYCGTTILCAGVPATWSDIAALVISAADGGDADPEAAFESIGHKFATCTTATDGAAVPNRLEAAVGLLRALGHLAEPPCASVR